MKRIFIAILLMVVSVAAVCQGINSKAIEVTNVDSDDYTTIETTKLRIKLPKNFTRRNATTYDNLLAESYISVQPLDGDVNRNFYTFDKKTMFRAGIVVLKETFFKINGFDAMMIDGEQFINDKDYAVSILIIGNCTQSYLIMGATPKPIQNNMNLEITTSLLSVIFNPKMENSPISDAFSYRVNLDGTGLVEVAPMGDTRTFTDDGNLPSKTADMTSLTIREKRGSKQLTDEQKKEICSIYMNLYPLTWDEKSDLTPHEYTAGKLSGFEAYANGVNKFLKTEFLYILVLYADDRYYVLTGMSYGDEDKCLKMFRNVANTIEY